MWWIIMALLLIEFSKVRKRTVTMVQGLEKKHASSRNEFQPMEDRDYRVPDSGRFCFLYFTGEQLFRFLNAS